MRFNSDLKFEVIIVESFPKLEKDIKLLIQEAPQIPGSIIEEKKNPHRGTK